MKNWKIDSLASKWPRLSREFMDAEIKKEINRHLVLALIGATGKVRKHIEAAQEALNSKKKDKKRRSLVGK